MKLFGLIGYPLGHSFSKQYFTEKFDREQLTDCRFELFELRDIGDFGLLLKNETALKGLAVTIPYKESVIPFLDIIDKDAALIGAVNCISISSGKLTGYNTDHIGFEMSLKPLLKIHHTKALVLGSGGASKAVQYVLQKLEIEYLVVTRNRQPSNGMINYESLNEKIIQEYTLIINCTPVGMFPHEKEEPEIPYHYLHAAHLLFDLIYKPSVTKFLSRGKQQGATIKNGYEMLVLQAEENWKIWFEV